MPFYTKTVPYSDANVLALALLGLGNGVSNFEKILELFSEIPL